MQQVFDRFAEVVGRHVARAWFFVACVALIVVWAPTFVFFKVDTWQLIINTATTIITFLLVALLQNTQDRTTRAINHKLDALLRGMAETLDDTGDADESGECSTELRRVAGVEMESSE